MLDWLIVGGGIHGTHLAASLLGRANVAPERLRIVDPGPRLLHRWRENTALTGMRHLRSPSVHHLAMESWDLQVFAGKRRRRKRHLFAAPYDRPSLDLFNRHSDQVIETFNLADLHVIDRVASMSLMRDVVDVTTGNGEVISARNVVLAIGASEQARWPDWAQPDDGVCHHIFDPHFSGWPQKSSSESVAVIGGGISGAQVALRLVLEGHRVRLVSRHPLREHQFDSASGWLGPKYMAAFKRTKTPDDRRQQIRQARHTGSVSPDIRSALQRNIDGDKLDWHEAEVRGVVSAQAGARLTLSTDESFEVDRVLLATGFEPHRPGGTLVDNLVADHDLQCASCGYPIVDGALRWHPNVFVSGPLAELEIGPASRNIAGARRAADRIIPAALAAAPRPPRSKAA